MYGLYDKKNINIIILRILWEHTDENHRLQQQEIVQLVKQEYGMEIDRRTVKNNIEMLKDILSDTDYEISTEKGYCLLGRAFTDAELRMLIDSVLFSKMISQGQAKDLIGKLKQLSSKHFNAKVSHVYNLPNLQHADKEKQVLYNLDIINDAISARRKISFIYNKYDTDFQLIPRRNNYTYVTNPYHMVANNGFYYLICNFDRYEDLTHLRIDKMTEVTILDEKAKDKKLIPELKKGFNMPKHMAEHVYMYGGKSVVATIQCDEDIMDELVDWFGKEFRVMEQGNGRIKIRVTGNEQALFYWVLQYGDCAEILEPASLREKVRNTVEKMSKKYNSD